MRFTKKGLVLLNSVILGLIFMLSSLSAFAAGADTWTTKTAMANARGCHQIAVVGGKIYAIGGSVSSVYLNSVEEYDPLTNKWITKATMPTARRYHQVAVVNDRIYVIGGQNSSGFLSSIEEYNPATNTWIAKASMSTARCYHQVAVVDGKIYAIGGYNSNNGYLNSVEEYDPATNTWNTKAPMSTARQHYQAAVVDGKIYAVGGFNGSNGYLNSTEEYDPATNTWTTRASMNNARRYHQVAVMGRRLYVIGGNYAGSYLDSVEEYNPALNKWTTKASMPTARYYHEVAVVGEKIYAIGGYNNNYLNSIEEYNPATNTWTPKTAMPVSRQDFKVAAIGGKIYTVGGYNSGYISSVEEYTTEYSSLQSPTNLKVRANNTKVDLSWTAINGATSYRIKRATTEGGPYITVATNSTLTYTDTNLTNGITYYYVVSAVNADGESLNSDEVSATPSPYNIAVSLEVNAIDKAKLGNEITANVVIHNATNICAEDIKIAYDTTKLQFIGNGNVEGIRIFNTDNTTGGAIRFITASLGKANAANDDKILLTLKFKAIDVGEARIGITSGRIADNATLETDITQENCGEKTVLIEAITKDVNRTGEYTLLDLGIDAWYYGDSAAETDTSKYDADQIINGTIDDDDLTEVVAQILGNTNYSANK